MIALNSLEQKTEGDKLQKHASDQHHDPDCTGQRVMKQNDGCRKWNSPAHVKEVQKFITIIGSSVVCLVPLRFEN